MIKILFSGPLSPWHIIIIMIIFILAAPTVLKGCRYRARSWWTEYATAAHMHSLCVGDGEFVAIARLPGWWRRCPASSSRLPVCPDCGTGPLPHESFIEFTPTTTRAGRVRWNAILRIGIDCSGTTHTSTSINVSGRQAAKPTQQRQSCISSQVWQQKEKLYDRI